MKHEMKLKELRILQRHVFMLLIAFVCFSIALSSPSRYLASDCFRRVRNIVSTRISTFLFSYSTWKETKLVLLSLAIVTLKI